jgi:DNA-binding response OmpR family regulator
MLERAKRVLCIEDESETATLIAEELIDRGFEVSIAYSGQDGLAAILREKPDLVLSDISMPGMSGFEVLERLVRLAPRLENMPFILLTALADRDNELRGRRLGADDYVTKPIDFDVLEAIIRTRLARAARSEIWPSDVRLSDREADYRLSHGQCAQQARRGQSHVGRPQGCQESAYRTVALRHVTNASIGIEGNR